MRTLALTQTCAVHVSRPDRWLLWARMGHASDDVISDDDDVSLLDLKDKGKKAKQDQDPDFSPDA